MRERSAIRLLETYKLDLIIWVLMEYFLVWWAYLLGLAAPSYDFVVSQINPV